MHDTTRSADALYECLSMGWALVPVHDVSRGTCSCELGPACRSAGKHPRYKRWHDESQLIRSAETVRAVVAAHPEWNWGAATGAPSSMWVLDHDPKNAGVEATALLGRLLGETSTRRHVTGSQGSHVIFSFEGVDWPIGNGRGRLPTGLDVRGTGGQIVLPGSVSDRGAYAVATGGRPKPAPAWLLDMIRPSSAQGTHGGVSPSPTGAMIAGSDVAEDGRRTSSYAAVAGAAILDELRGAPVGTRNDTAYRVACRMIEFVNAGWIPSEWAHDAWWAAASAHPDGVHVPPSELAPMWLRALRAVGDKAAVLPAEWGGELIPFSTAGPTAPLSERGGQQPPDDPFEAAVHAEMARMQIRAEARRRADALAFDRAAARAALLAATVDSAGLDDISELVPLVDGVLDQNTVARVYGESGAGKSFVMLDIAGCVGTGLPWAGRTVTQGDVEYLIAEGQAGLRKRVRAWERQHDRKMTGVQFTLVPVQTAALEWDVFVELCVERAPRLIVIDTQARVTLGMEENSAAEMGTFIAAVDRLRAATGACVVLVHHKGVAGGDRARGSSAIKGAMDTELSVSKSSDIVTVTNAKQKNDIESDDIAFKLVSVELDGERRPGASLVWQPAELRVLQHFVSDEELTGLVGRVALVAAEVFAGGIGGTKAEYMAVVMGERKITKSKATFYRVWSDLMKRRIIGKIHGTQSWRYIPMEDRGSLIEPIQGVRGEEGGFYAP